MFDKVFIIVVVGPLAVAALIVGVIGFMVHDYWPTYIALTISLFSFLVVIWAFIGVVQISYFKMENGRIEKKITTKSPA